MGIGGQGRFIWFSSETIMCWFTARGRAAPSHSFLLTGKWLSVRLTVRKGVHESEKRDGVEGGRLKCYVWKKVVFKVLCSECQAVCCILPWDLQAMGERADHTGELGTEIQWLVCLQFDLEADAYTRTIFCWDGKLAVSFLSLNFMRASAVGNRCEEMYFIHGWWR